MTIKIEDDAIVFSSGRTLYANRGIVGISPGGDLSEGYDGDIDWPSAGCVTSPYTRDDMSELADEMIARWTRFKASLP